jgi:hypothetical protein
MLVPRPTSMWVHICRSLMRLKTRSIERFLTSCTTVALLDGSCTKLSCVSWYMPANYPMSAYRNHLYKNKKAPERTLCQADLTISVLTLVSIINSLFCSDVALGVDLFRYFCERYHSIVFKAT